MARARSASQGRNQQKRASAKGAKTSPKGAVSSGALPWSLDASWTLLLAALVATPLIIVNLSWLPGEHGVLFHSGAPLVKALVAELLVGASLICYCIALIQGAATIRWNRVAWLGVAFVGWSLVTVAFSVSPATALIGFTTNSNGWFALATYAVAGFLVLQLADGAPRIRTLLRTTAITASAIAAYGLIQTLGRDPLNWGVTSWGAFRSFGTIGNPDMFGAYMLLNVFVALGLLLSESDRRWRIGYAAMTVLLAAATFTSLTRAAWLGAVAGAVVFAIAVRRSRLPSKRTLLIVAGVVLVLVAGAAALSLSNTDVDSNVIRRATTAFSPNDKNTLGRTETWRVAAIAIADRPLVGYGPDAFYLAFGPRRTPAYARLVEPNIAQPDAHSSLIQLAVESGIPGVLLWLALLGTVGVAGWRVLRRGDPDDSAERFVFAGVFASAAAFLVASLLTPASSPSSLLLWSFMAVLLSPAATTADAGRLRAFAYAGVLVGAAAIVGAATCFYADGRAAVANDETVAPAARMVAADAAVGANPLSAEYDAVRAKAYAQDAMRLGSEQNPQPDLVKARFDTALASMNRAVALESTNPHTRATLVSLLLIGGQYVNPAYNTQAVSVARDALNRAPNDLETMYWLARAYVSTNQDQQAAAILEKVVAARPDYVDAVIVLSDVKSKAGDAAGARAVLETAVQKVGEWGVLASRLKALGASGK